MSGYYSPYTGGFTAAQMAAAAAAAAAQQSNGVRRHKLSAKVLAMPCQAQFFVNVIAFADWIWYSSTCVKYLKLSPF